MNKGKVEERVDGKSYVGGEKQEMMMTAVIDRMAMS